MFYIKPHSPLHDNKWILSLNSERMYVLLIIDPFDTVLLSTSLNTITYLLYLPFEPWFAFPFNFFFFPLLFDISLFRPDLVLIQLHCACVQVQIHALNHDGTLC